MPKKKATKKPAIAKAIMKSFWGLYPLFKRKPQKRCPKKLIKQYDAVARYEKVAEYPFIISKK